MKVDQKERTPFLNVFGLAPLTIYTKPFKCGGKCLFCFTQENVPKSFFENEDTIPAQEVNWDAGKQLELLYEKKNIKRGVGNKIEVIILPSSLVVRIKILTLGNCFFTCKVVSSPSIIGIIISNSKTSAD